MSEFDIEFVDESDPHLPGGLNGIGILGTAGVQATIANAIDDAIGQRCAHCRFGLNIREYGNILFWRLDDRTEAKWLVKPCRIEGSGRRLRARGNVIDGAGIRNLQDMQTHVE